MGDLTANFSVWEIACQCGCGLSAIDMDILGRMQMIRDMYGKKITISSGCRCIPHNRNEGGRPGSYHLPGIWRQEPGLFSQAIDWTTRDKKLLKEINKFWEPIFSGGWHYYPERNFIHCDVRASPPFRWE